MKKMEIEIKVGLFVSIGLGLIMLAILVLGSTENLLSRQSKYSLYFPSVEGLIPGAKVILSGVSAGTVQEIDLDESRRQVRVNIAIAKKYTAWIKKDSTAEIATQGVLGDKLVVLTLGSIDQAVLPSGSEIPSKSSQDLTQFLSKGDKLMSSLTSLTSSLDHIVKGFDFNGRSDTFFQGMAATAKNMAAMSGKMNEEFDGIHLKSATKNLDAILAKINDGTGTIGALINDPALYDDLKALLGGANRNRIIRNLVRQTIKGGETVAEPAPIPAPTPAPKK